jgi:UMF1 family MFS transporter
MGKQEARAEGATGVYPWVAFDFINSIVIINGTVHFSAWLAGTEGVDARWYGFAYVMSGVLLLLGLPLLGSFIDRRRAGRPVLIVTSLLMVACSLAIVAVGRWDDGALRAVLALVVFGLMNTVYQASLVAYNWLLVYLRGVKTENDVRRVSGYGEAAGMAGSVVGSVVGIALIAWLTNVGSKEPRVDMFLALGLLFLVGAAVDFALMRPGIDDSRAPVVRLRYRRVWLEWVKVLRDEGSLRRFFFAFLLFANGVLTVQLYLAIYMQNVLRFGPEASAGVFALALVSATGGGLLYAKLGSRHDTRRAILILLLLLGPAMLGLAWARDAFSFVPVLLLVGLLYGGLWGASRAHLIELSHRARLGRALAFFAVFERSASILGPVLWAAVLTFPGSEGVRYSFAISAMAAMVVGGALVMWRDIRVSRVPGARRTRRRRPQPSAA